MKGHKEHHHHHGRAHEHDHHAHEHETHKKVKHHSMRHHRKAGGKVDSAMHGVNEAEMDLKSRPKHYNNSNVETEAEATHERKHGGRAKKAKHHAGHVKHIGHVHGEHAAHHAGRKPRKSGGRASSDMNPFTSARHGTPPKGHKVEVETMG